MEQAFYPLENTVQPYEWGSRTAIQELLGTSGDMEGPAAELWMGTHPKGPSTAVAGSRRIPLGDLIRTDPPGFLGAGPAERFEGDLPFLFKILAAASPLSIQAHPDPVQAREGFERENRSGIPLTAPERNYKDPNHKPECICALTPFWVMRGFRTPDAVAELLERYCPRSGKELAVLVARRPPSEGLRAFFSTLMEMAPAAGGRVVEEAVDSARSRPSEDPVARWIRRLSESYPGDIGVVSPLFVNTLRMAPGEAMYLPAGELHAYLEGVGVEIMANSDNVLRGGLTPKHMDVAELIRVLRFEPVDPKGLRPVRVSSTEVAYPTPAQEFALSELRIPGGKAHRSARERNGEILLAVEGEAVLSAIETDGRHRLRKGRSVFIPAATGSYRLEGGCRVFKAGIPNGPSSGPPSEDGEP